MMKTQQEKLKRQIVTLVKRSGLPVGTQYIVDHVALPEHVVLNDLLTELVAERRLRRSYTLLVNGDPDCIYDLIS
jgi:hypothetical protein